jgi:hypothetical protein
MSTSTTSGETIAGDMKLMYDVREKHSSEVLKVHTEER